MISKIQIVMIAMVPLAVAGATSMQPVALEKAPKKAGVPFSKVAALLKKECAQCHTGARAAGKVDVTSYATLMKGGEHGPVIVASHPEKSALLAYIDGSKKPQMPMGKPALSKADVALVKTWIAGGAKK